MFTPVAAGEKNGATKLLRRVRSLFSSFCSLMMSAHQRTLNCGGASGKMLSIFSSPPPAPSVTFASAPGAAPWIKASYLELWQ